MRGHYTSSKFLPIVWIILSLLMLGVDYVTGPIIQFPVFYVFPIALATWYSGPWWGGALAVILPLGRVFFSMVWEAPWRTMGHVTINTGIRIVAFSLLVFLIHKVITKSRDIKEQRQAEQRLREQQKQLRILTADLAVAEETERRRIAAGLHDDINQMLIAAKLKLATLSPTSAPAAISAVSADVDKSLDQALASSQSLVFDLVSPVLQRLGLAAALDDLCERMEQQHGVVFQFIDEGDTESLSNEVEIIVFRAVRELMRNAVRHAEARHVRVVFRQAQGAVTIAVEDDGTGFNRDLNVDGPTPSGGFGLFTIHERMEYLGGSIRIEPVLPHGSRVALTVPLRLQGEPS